MTRNRAISATWSEIRTQLPVVWWPSEIVDTTTYLLFLVRYPNRQTPKSERGVENWISTAFVSLMNLLNWTKVVRTTVQPLSGCVLIYPTILEKIVEPKISKTSYASYSNRTLASGRASPWWTLPSIQQPRPTCCHSAKLGHRLEPLGYTPLLLVPTSSLIFCNREQIFPPILIFFIRNGWGHAGK